MLQEHPLETFSSTNNVLTAVISSTSEAPRYSLQGSIEHAALDSVMCRTALNAGLNAQFCIRVPTTASFLHTLSLVNTKVSCRNINSVNSASMLIVHEVLGNLSQSILSPSGSQFCPKAIQITIKEDHSH